jgi:hypothetical protein
VLRCLIFKMQAAETVSHAKLHHCNNSSQHGFFVITKAKKVFVRDQVERRETSVHSPRQKAELFGSRIELLTFCVLRALVKQT